MLNDLSTIKSIKSRSVSAENVTGEKGKGAMRTDGTGAHFARELGLGWKISPNIYIEPGETAILADIHTMGAIKHFWTTNDAVRSRELILRIYWDDSETPSVEAPLADFFACGCDDNHYGINSISVCVNPFKGYNCYWEMPFKKGFKFTVQNLSEQKVSLFYQIDYEEKEIGDNSAYFHAQFRRVNPLPYKEVYTILDNIHGKGHYVGTYLLWGSNNNGWWGEGEIKFYIDGDSEFPTICGTGTEDYICGAWCFAENGKYLDFSSAYSGFKSFDADNTFKSQKRFSMYRWHIQDPVYFDKDIKVTIQALGWRSDSRYLPLQDDISSVAFWYQDTICKEFPPFPDRNELEVI